MSFERLKRLSKQGWCSAMVEAICWLYFLLFAYAAFDKLMGYDKFVVTMGQSGMLTPYASVLAWLVPLVEVVLALMLVLNWFRLFGLYAAFGLMTMFTTYIFMVLYVMEKELCGCGAAIEALGWGWHMVLNAGFVVLGVIAIVLVYKGQNSHSPPRLE
ncbi:MauE/DoxX family redox-associated membrane protein [Pedobacter africanus]|uniref:Membrane protein YphA (DoxX/SURF4 family) n=2 Tax=Pedobacter africanus TaxID=151894 RepID=A0ACC6KTY3_9SPHI|nr:MauE/DoxX family redox-associated membrane protein [Pedobacter africanus]MDR6782666.1 putative membrane protein YphA (DoxX/SURF4 family) [Pedobacter africanus]